MGLDKLKIDDPVGVISVHGTVGLWGLLAVCISNPDSSLMAQLKGIFTIFVWTMIMSLITWSIIRLAMGIRVSDEEDYEGLDIGECGLEAYPEFVSTSS